MAIKLERQIPLAEDFAFRVEREQMIAAALAQARAEEREAADRRMLDFCGEMADAFEKDGKIASAATIRGELKRARQKIADAEAAIRSAAQGEK